MFATLYLQQYKTTLLYLYVPHYNNMIKHTTLNNTISEISTQEDVSFDQSTTVAFIWIVWFFMTYFMNIMIINFLISIICASYERVKGHHKIISYRQKAMLNLEYFEILNLLGYKRKFKIIAMSTSKEDEGMKDGMKFSETAERIAEFLRNQNKKFMEGYVTQKRDVHSVIESNN